MLDPSLDIGDALRAARQALGLSLTDISETTRIRERHLAAIESGLVDQLPSRPFTIGYVRAYAKALGLDADATASRYRTEFPSPDDNLHTPVGVRSSGLSARSGLVIAVVVVAIASVVAWNVTRRVQIASPAKAPPVAAPRAEPPEATAPAPYYTPVAGADNAAPANALAASPSTFAPAGAIYGSAAGASPLIIQAKASISLEIRGAAGAVYFARQLAPGEAYRVPALPNLTAEVSNPASAELYVGGVDKGPFTQAQTPLKLAE
jgi:transcriptional regulator with XRE-family HTH domain